MLDTSALSFNYDEGGKHLLVKNVESGAIYLSAKDVRFYKVFDNFIVIQYSTETKVFFDSNFRRNKGIIHHIGCEFYKDSYFLYLRIENDVIVYYTGIFLNFTTIRNVTSVFQSKMVVIRTLDHTFVGMLPLKVSHDSKLVEYNEGILSFHMENDHIVQYRVKGFELMERFIQTTMKMVEHVSYCSNVIGVSSNYLKTKENLCSPGPQIPLIPINIKKSPVNIAHQTYHRQYEKLLKNGAVTESEKVCQLLSCILIIMDNPSHYMQMANSILDNMVPTPMVKASLDAIKMDLEQFLLSINDELGDHKVNTLITKINDLVKQ